MRKSSALLMGILIISVIMLLAVVLGYSTLKALSSGTNVTDQTIANQAAEAGIENALLALSDIGQLSGGQQALIDDNYFGLESVTNWIMCQGDADPPCHYPANNDPNYRRRNMSVLTSGISHENISNSTIPNNQYWNYKIWRRYDADDNYDSANSRFWPNTSYTLSSTVSPSLITYRLDGRAPACQNLTGGDDPLNDCNNTFLDTVSNDVYSFRSYIKGNYTDNFPPNTEPTSVTINYWSWTDNCPTMNVIADIPRTCDDPANNPVPGMDTQIRTWDEFTKALGSLDGLYISSDPSIGGAGGYHNYAHVYYNLIPDTPVNHPADPWSTSNRTAVRQNGASTPLDYYVIDAVGMFGIEKVYKRAWFNPYTMQTWRVNQYN